MFIFYIKMTMLPFPYPRKSILTPSWDIQSLPQGKLEVLVMNGRPALQSARVPRRVRVPSARLVHRQARICLSRRKYSQADTHCRVNHDFMFFESKNTFSRCNDNCNGHAYSFIRVFNKPVFVILYVFIGNFYDDN